MGKALLKLKKEFIRLSWELIEAKILYYYPDKFKEEFLNDNHITDIHYDMMEQKYVRLCKLLKLPNTVESMVQVDFNRPSVQLALARLEAKGSSSRKVRKFRKQQFTQDRK